MRVDAASLMRLSHAWEEQRLDLVAAGRGIADAPTGGFTAAVAGPATSFTAAWERHVADLADRAGALADALEDAVEGYVATDAAVGERATALEYRTWG